MKKNIIWIQTEYKRAAAMLPFILGRAVLLAAVCLAAAGLAVFCAQKLPDDKGGMQKLRIGYVAEDQMLTQLAVSYVQGMESVQSLCSLEPVTEQEGRRLLEKGELSGLIVLPEDVMNEILSGSNAPAKLYLPQGGGLPDGGLRAVADMLFEELASAGMGMLGTAQAEIYAAGNILAAAQGTGNPAASGDVLQAMYDDINKFNLGVVAGREELFHTENLSLTGKDTYAVYYGSALLTVYGMFSGLFPGAFCKRSSLQQAIARTRIGVGYTMQLTARYMAGGMLMLPVMLLPLLLSAIPRVRDVLPVKLTAAGITGIFLITVFLTVYNMFLYEIVEKQESMPVVIGVLAVFQAYMSGCLIPSVLLPGAVAGIGGLLPAAFVKAGFTAFLTGGTRELLPMAKGLALWGAVLSAATRISMQAGEKNRPSTQAAGASAGMHVPSIYMVMLRRLLHKKSIWLCMGLVAVLSVVTVRVEKGSETQIKAAVYDASGALEALLGDYQGLVRFEICDSGEQVRAAVLNGDAECGYILPEDLTERMTARKANRAVTVCRDADAVAVPVVNEILFERIFRQASLAWYADYMYQNSMITGSGADREWLARQIDSSFDRQLDATFRLEIERTGTRDASGAGDGKGTTYPAYTVAAAAVLLCTAQGAVQVVSDIRGRRFYKRNRVAVSVLTIVLPVALGLLTALLTIGLAG